LLVRKKLEISSMERFALRLISLESSTSADVTWGSKFFT